MGSKVNILFVFPASQLWGGEQAWINLLNRLDRRKYSIFVLTFGSGELVKKLENINVVFYRLEKARIRNIFLFLKNLLKVTRILRKEKIDIVNSLGVHLLTTLSVSISAIRYILHIHTIHPLPSIDRWCVRRARHLVTASDFSKQFLIQYGVKKEYIQVIYNGIDTEELKRKVNDENLRKQLQLQEDTKIVCYVGRIIESKNLNMLIQAIPKIKESYQGRVKFLFVGETPKTVMREPDYKDILLRSAKELGGENDVIFTGRRDDVINILEQIDIFVSPSPAEVCSMAILEAMAMAKPVVAKRVGGNPELVSKNTGILVEPDDSNGFSEAIIELLTNKEKRQIMGKAGKKRVEELFSIERNVDTLQEIFEKLICV